MIFAYYNQDKLAQNINDKTNNIEKLKTNIFAIYNRTRK